MTRERHLIFHDKMIELCKTRNCNNEFTDLIKREEQLALAYRNNQQVILSNPYFGNKYRLSWDKDDKHSITWDGNVIVAYGLAYDEDMGKVLVVHSTKNGPSIIPIEKNLIELLDIIQ